MTFGLYELGIVSLLKKINHNLYFKLIDFDLFSDFLYEDLHTQLLDLFCGKFTQEKTIGTDLFFITDLLSPGQAVDGLPWPSLHELIAGILTLRLGAETGLGG